MRWRVNPHQPLSFFQHQEEEEVVVYQPASGDLHLVTAVSARILELLQETSLTSSELLQQMVPNKAGLNQNEQSADLYRSHLRPFLKLGLIESADK
ncbi:HPr-rel-A system PqqD family peptide chaperone [Pseudomonadota bacterium]